MKNEPGKNGGAADGAESGLAEEHTFHGIAVSPGIAIGPAHVSDHFDQAVPQYRIEPDAVAEEPPPFAAPPAAPAKHPRKLNSKAQDPPQAPSQDTPTRPHTHPS